MDGVGEIGIEGALESRWFDDFYIGERFLLPTRTLSLDLFRAFADVSGEAHPLHVDEEYCERRGHPGLLAHGFLIASQTVAGAGLFSFQVEESLIGLIEQSSRFVRQAHAGDTLRPVLQITELAPNTSTGVIGMRSTVHNQRRELVLEGSQRWLLRRRR